MRSAPDFPDTFQGASYLMCHRDGHGRTPAEPSRGQGDFRQPLAHMEKLFASGKLVRLLLNCENLFAKAAMVICVGKCIARGIIIPDTSD